jgi:hypothetical protein
MKSGVALLLASLALACQEPAPPEPQSQEAAPDVPLGAPPRPARDIPPGTAWELPPRYTPETPIERPPQQQATPQDESAVVFAPGVVHELELEVDPLLVGQLRLDNDERVPAAFVYDGLRLENIGVKLKGHGTGREITAKASFSIKFDEFVPEQKLHGLKKLTVNNSVTQDAFPSRVLGYEIWRRAGVPAPRTAYARVTFNGEYFGLYVIEEAYSKQFLKQNFADASGNLYEGEKENGWGVEITDVDNMDLETNEEANDRSELIALRQIVLNSPDATLLADISAVLNVDELITYWAVERLTYHWDGYGTVRDGDPDCCSPHNYSVYNDPAGGLVFMPRGADTLFRQDDADVGLPPRPKAVMGLRLYNLPEVRGLLAARMDELLNEIWDPGALIGYLDPYAALALGAFVEGGREEITRAELEQQFDDCRQFILRRADLVRARLAQGL